MRTLVALVAGAGFGLGVWLVVSAWWHPPAPETGGRRSGGPAVAVGPVMVRRLAVAVLVAVAVGVLTGWPVGGLLAGAAVLGLPPLLGRDRDHQATLARVEAVASWTELLRDTLAAAAGVQQTILATAPLAPGPIRVEVGELAQQLRQGVALRTALAGFADRMADPIADLVVAALTLAADRPSANLGPLLGELAASAREQSAMRQRVATSRARVRTSARIITGITMVMTVGMVLWNPQWMSAYDSAGGQLMMLLAGLMFAAGLYALRRMAQVPTPPRLLANAAGGG